MPVITVLCCWGTRMEKKRLTNVIWGGESFAGNRQVALTQAVCVAELCLGHSVGSCLPFRGVHLLKAAIWQEMCCLKKRLCWWSCGREPAELGSEAALSLRYLPSLFSFCPRASERLE